MKKHKITNAYEAYWFIYNHPKFMLEERHEVSAKKAAKLEAGGFWITRDKGGKCYRMHRHLHRHAIDLNLSIFYTKTNKPGGHGTVDDDKSKNKHVECWLEFGKEEYMYMAGGEYDWDTETHRAGYHDIDLDCGAPTFDEALIRLAKLVRKHYGDYVPNGDGERQHGKCGKPVCADCKDIGRTMKRLGLSKKEDKVKRA